MYLLSSVCLHSIYIYTTGVLHYESKSIQFGTYIDCEKDDSLQMWVFFNDGPGEL